MIWYVTTGTITLPEEKPKVLTKYQKAIIILWDFVDDPSSSWGAYILSLYIMILIFVSTLTFMIETVPPYNITNGSVRYLF